MKHFYVHIIKLLNVSKPTQQLLRKQMADWCKDPLSHPDIIRMSERQRADLQFNPRCIKSE